MPYRYLVKRVVSQAAGSYMASGLLRLSQDQLWDKLAVGRHLPAEEAAKVRAEVEAALRDVEARGRPERELLEQLVRESLSQILKEVSGR